MAKKGRMMVLYKKVRSGWLDRPKRHVVLGLVVGLALFSLIILVNREPSYRSRTLTSWLTQCSQTSLMEVQRLAEAQ